MRKKKLPTVKVEKMASLSALAAVLGNYPARELKERLRRAGLPIPKDKAKMIERLADAYLLAGASVTTTVTIR